MTLADELVEPTINYAWVDEDGNRVSPKHTKLGEAISWIQRRPAHLRKIALEEQRNEEYHQRWPENADQYEREQKKISEARQKATLTGKEPVELNRIVIRRAVESISSAEKAVIDQIRGESS